MATTTLGKRLKKLRESKNFGLRELARKVEISASFLCEIEGGRSYPSTSVLERLASELGVTAGALRKLDLRSHIPPLKDLLRTNPEWGPVFLKIAEQGRLGTLTPEALGKKLD